MKKIVKSTISFYRLLIEHGQKPYEPSPQHILSRMLIPMCNNFDEIIEKGTKNDTWELINGFSKECNGID